MLVFIYLFLHNDLAGTKYDQLKESLFWIILFGPWLFPLSLIIWHAYQLSQGETNFMKFENVARSRVLNSLSVLTKSAVQAGLYILTQGDILEKIQIFMEMLRLYTLRELSRSITQPKSPDHLVSHQSHSGVEYHVKSS